jgi:spectinomycin phosphotransferase
MAAFLKIKRSDILDLVHRADRLARELQTDSPDFVLCHSDAHAGNVLIGNDGTFFVIDWDDPIYAAKERDLMFVGAGIGGIWNTAREESLFYAGYGETDVNLLALAYYRVERIVQDIAVYCEQIFLTEEGGADREQSFEYLKSNFLPHSMIDIAVNTETSARAAAGANSRHRPYMHHSYPSDVFSSGRLERR